MADKHCAVCGGRGYVTCSVCDGHDPRHLMDMSGEVCCCGGSGRVVCMACDDGSLEAEGALAALLDECKDCGGLGMHTCPDCPGVRVSLDDPRCAGCYGYQLCTTCKGAGLMDRVSLDDLDREGV